MKAYFSTLLRRLGLLWFADRLKFRLQKWRKRQDNRAFRQAHPEFALPSDYSLFESYQLDYQKYYEDGRETARWVWEQIQPCLVDDKAGRLLDWGCGPARVVRHLPAILNPNWKIYGADYNLQTVEWCKKHISGVSFSGNDLCPPLPFPDDYFDGIYGISIFTHLSEENHLSWQLELIRVIKPGGVLLLTTQGDAFRSRLTENEKKKFDKGQLVVRDQVREGHRLYSAFQPLIYLQSLFSSHTDILKHEAGKQKDWGIEQDVWVLRRKL